MNAPVDLTNLRSMTDGDVELEKTLFEEFYTSFEKGILALRTNCANSSAEAWRSNAHALKGVALNLGAEKLGALCKKAQDDHGANENAKELMLQAIETEYNDVKVFLQKSTLTYQTYNSPPAFLRVWPFPNIAATFSAILVAIASSVAELEGFWLKLLIISACRSMDTCP